jgi:transcriptional regulator with XRE-family HTH domain
MTVPTKKSKITVAQYIEQLIALSGKTQTQIAEEVGYDKPNVITMIKQGKTKLPINKVGLFAQALGIDPVYLLRATMSEYMPDTWQSIETLFQSTLVTQNELKILKTIREASNGRDIEFGKEQREQLTRLAKESAKV